MKKRTLTIAVIAVWLAASATAIVLYIHARQPSAQCRSELATFTEADKPVTVNMGPYGYQTIPTDAPVATWALGAMRQAGCPDTPGR